MENKIFYCCLPILIKSSHFPFPYFSARWRETKAMAVSCCWWRILSSSQWTKQL